MSEHVDQLAGLLLQFRWMGTVLCDAPAIGHLAASIEVNEHAQVTTAFKTLAEKDLKREEAESRPIEKDKLKRKGSNSNRASTADHYYSLCGMQSHSTERCFLSRLDSNDTLSVLAVATQSLRAPGRNKKTQKHERNNDPKRRRNQFGGNEVRVGIAGPEHKKINPYNTGSNDAQQGNQFS